jgi:hypothetical protein
LPGDWHSYPSRTKEAEAQLIYKSPEVFHRASCLRWPGRVVALPIYMILSAGLFPEPPVKIRSGCVPVNAADGLIGLVKFQYEITQYLPNKIVLL